MRGIEGSRINYQVTRPSSSNKDGLGVAGVAVANLKRNSLETDYVLL